MEHAEDFASNTFAKKQKYEEQHMPKPEIPEQPEDDLLTWITEFLFRKTPLQLSSLHNDWNFPLSLSLPNSGIGSEGNHIKSIPSRDDFKIQDEKRATVKMTSEEEQSVRDPPQIEEVEDESEEEDEESTEGSGREV